MVGAGADVDLANDDGETPNEIMAAKQLKEAVKRNDLAGCIAALDAGKPFVDLSIAGMFY